MLVSWNFSTLSRRTGRQDLLNVFMPRISNVSIVNVNTFDICSEIMESRYWILILLELELSFIICDTLSIIVLLSSIGSLNFNSDNKDVFFIFVIYSIISMKILDSFKHNRVLSIIHLIYFCRHIFIIGRNIYRCRKTRLHTDM